MEGGMQFANFLFLCSVDITSNKTVWPCRSSTRYDASALVNLTADCHFSHVPKVCEPCSHWLQQHALLEPWPDWLKHVLCITQTETEHILIPRLMQISTCEDSKTAPVYFDVSLIISVTRTGNKDSCLPYSYRQ